MITRIDIDLTAWTEHYPTGCVLYNGEEEVDSDFCDNAEEFIEFIDTYKDFLAPKACQVRILLDAFDLDNGTAIECAQKVWAHVHDLIY